MARIFISHSSANNAEAVALRDWLVSEGWDDLFLDLDPSRGIAAGERWERALNEAANRCEAVLFLVSAAWLSSRWCLKELNLALKLNKRIFGVLIEDIPLADMPTDLTASWQTVNLASGSDHIMLRVTLPRDGAEVHVTFSRSGLQRLKAGLTKAGLDARFFAWPPESEPDRSPYRGMRPLEAEDAGIFLGRDAAIIEGLDRLRGLSEAAPPRFLTILGASGAGKSSFLRAGLLPRLWRDDRNFMVLPIVRPERAVLFGETGLVNSLVEAAKAAGLKRSRAEIRAAVEAGLAAVLPIFEEIAEQARAPELGGEKRTAPPRFVLPIDQGEELFLAEGADEAQVFLGLVNALASAASSNLIVLVTIRSDSYEQLQTAPALEGLQQQTLSLPPLQRGAYQTIIEGPAARLKDTRRPLKIEAALIAALLADVEDGGAKDALPLLAFTLERLYTEYGGDGDLRLVEYNELGGIRGSIEAAVERALKAADQDPAVPKDRGARLALIRRALIPWLAGIDPETGSPRRRVARLSEIPEEARPLVDHLVAERLLATDVSPETGERTIEPAHEALLRQWGLLQGWLDEDFAALATLEGIRRAATEWDANGKEEAWLAHGAGRLEDAEAISRREDFAASLEATDRAYLAACRAADTARRDRELEEARKLAEAQKEAADQQRNVARRTRLGLIAATVLAVAAIALAAFGFNQTEIAIRQTAIAEAKTAEAVGNETVGLAALARVALAEGFPSEAVQLALAAWPRTGDSDRPPLRRTISSLGAALPWLREQTRLKGHEDHVTSATFSPDGARVVTASFDKTARIWDAMTGVEIVVLKGHDEGVVSAAFSPNGTRVVTASYDDTARIWEATTGAGIAVLGHENSVTSATFSRDGARVVTASKSEARVWDATTGITIAVLRDDLFSIAIITSAAFSPDGARVVTASKDRTARTWDAATGAQIVVLKGHEGVVNSATFSPDGGRVVTASSDGTARIWDAMTGVEIVVLKGHNEGVRSATFSPDGARVVTASFDKTARIWDAATGALIVVLKGHDDDVVSATFSPDGARVVTASWDKTARLWDAATGAMIALLEGHEDAVTSATFSPDGARVATASRDRTARTWDVTRGVEIVVLRGHDDLVRSAAFSPDGRRIVTESTDNTARVWNATTGVNIAVLKGDENGVDSVYSVTSASFSPDSERVVTGSSDGTARIWDAATATTIAVLKGHDGIVYSAAFSPDSARVVLASDSSAQVWDVATGAEVAVLKGHENWVNSAAFSPDGARVVTASPDKTARIWDAATGALIVVLKGHENWVNSAAFSPDGALIVTASMDKTARIWDAATGAMIAVFKEHEDWVHSAAFSPSGTRMVTASSDGTARVWDVKTGTTIALLNGHAGKVYSAAFSPDGARVVIASADKTARIWDLSTLEKGDAFAIACARLGINIDLADVRARYGLREIAPICGEHPPLPVNPAILE